MAFLISQVKYVNILRHLIQHTAAALAFAYFSPQPSWFIHFPKIHRSVLRKITIDLLYF